MASTINAASAAALSSNKAIIISASLYPAAVSLLALPLCQPVQARLRLYKLVIEESVPALDHMQTLVKEKPDDMAHHFIGHAIGVERPWISYPGPRSRSRRHKSDRPDADKSPR